MVSLGCWLGRPPGHVGPFMPVSQWAKKGDCTGQADRPAYQGAEGPEDVPGMQEDSLGHLLVPQVL